MDVSHRPLPTTTHHQHCHVPVHNHSEELVLFSAEEHKQLSNKLQAEMDNEMVSELVMETNEIAKRPFSSISKETTSNISKAGTAETQFFQASAAIKIDHTQPPEPKRVRTKESPTGGSVVNSTTANKQWDTMFERLKAYKVKYGDCLVPKRFPEDPKLGTWVETQRVQYKKLQREFDTTSGVEAIQPNKRLNQERLAKLREIGFAWSAKTTRKTTKPAPPGTSVPHSANGATTGLFATETSRSRRGNGGSESTNGFKGNTVAGRWNDNQWEEMYQRLVKYKEKFGDCLVPRKFEEDTKLATWVETQRVLWNRDYRSGNDSPSYASSNFYSAIPSYIPDPVPGIPGIFPAEANVSPVATSASMDESGWTSQGATAEDAAEIAATMAEDVDVVAAAVAVAAEAVDASDESALKIPALTDQNPGAFHPIPPPLPAPPPQPPAPPPTNKRLTRERKEKLDALGFVWSLRSKRIDDHWDEMFRQLVEYKNKYGDCLVPSRFEENLKLGKWVETQRYEYTKLQRAALGGVGTKDIGKDLDVAGNTGSQSAMLTTNGVAVATPANGQGKARATNPRLTEERLRRLESIGFEWKVRNKMKRYYDKQWQDMFERLLKFKEANGHCMVPKRYPPDMKLGTWVHTQRIQYRKLMAGTKKDGNVELPPEPTFQNVSKEEMMSFRLTDERRKRLEEVGFIWSAREGDSKTDQTRITRNSYDDLWDAMFERLLAYKEKHGNCLVPKRYKDDPKLGTWVDTQRVQYKKMKKKIADQTGSEVETTVGSLEFLEPDVQFATGTNVSNLMKAEESQASASTNVVKAVKLEASPASALSVAAPMELEDNTHGATAMIAEKPIKQDDAHTTATRALIPKEQHDGKITSAIKVANPMEGMCFQDPTAISSPHPVKQAMPHPMEQADCKNSAGNRSPQRMEQTVPYAMEQFDCTTSAAISSPQPIEQAVPKSMEQSCCTTSAASCGPRPIEKDVPQLLMEQLYCHVSAAISSSQPMKEALPKPMEQSDCNTSAAIFQSVEQSSGSDLMDHADRQATTVSTIVESLAQTDLEDATALSRPRPVEVPNSVLATAGVPQSMEVDDQALSSTFSAHPIEQEIGQARSSLQPIIEKTELAIGGHAIKQEARQALVGRKDCSVAGATNATQSVQQRNDQTLSATMVAKQVKQEAGPALLLESGEQQLQRLEAGQAAAGLPIKQEADQTGVASVSGGSGEQLPLVEAGQVVAALPSVADGHPAAGHPIKQEVDQRGDASLFAQPIKQEDGQLVMQAGVARPIVGRLTEERIVRLEKIGFVWSLRDDWMKHFEELKKYKEQFGNCNVPARYTNNRRLGIWVSAQRQQYKIQKASEGEKGKQRSSPLTQGRIDLLNQIGFTWTIRSRDILGESWNQRLEDLKVYKAKYGNCLVPSRYPPNPELGVWVGTQRTQYRLFQKAKEIGQKVTGTSAMNEERIRQLEDLGFVWALRGQEGARKEFGVLYQPMDSFGSNVGCNVMETDSSFIYAPQPPLAGESRDRNERQHEYGPLSELGHAVSAVSADSQPVTENLKREFIQLTDNTIVVENTSDDANQNSEDVSPDAQAIIDHIIEQTQL